MELNGTILIQIAIFLTTLLWLSNFLFSPILTLFEKRDEKIKGSRAQAENITIEAAKKSKEFESEYQKAQLESKASLNALRQRINKEQEEALKKVKDMAHKKLEDAEEELRKDEAYISDELRKHGDVMAKEIVNRLLNA